MFHYQQKEIPMDPQIIASIIPDHLNKILVRIAKSHTNIKSVLLSAFEGDIPPAEEKKQLKYDPQYSIFHPADILENLEASEFPAKDTENLKNELTKLLEETSNFEEKANATPRDLTLYFSSFHKIRSTSGRQELSGSGRDKAWISLTQEEQLSRNPELLQFLCGAMAFHYINEVVHPKPDSSIVGLKVKYEFWRKQYNQFTKT